MKDAAYAEKSKLIKEKKEQAKQIQELKKQLAKKDSEKAAALQKQKEAHKEEIAHLEERIQEKQKQKEKLEREISEKYQKYIDRYDLIGGLVLESEEKAEKIIREANEKAEQVLNDADQQAETTTQNARKAADEAGRGYIALDLGPTGKLLKPLGDLPFEAAVSLYKEVVSIGVAAGADLVLIETMSDSYELKAAVLAAKEAGIDPKTGERLPIFATVIYDEKGKLLTGGNVESTVALLEGLGVDVLGSTAALARSR